MSRQLVYTYTKPIYTATPINQIEFNGSNTVVITGTIRQLVCRVNNSKWFYGGGPSKPPTIINPDGEVFDWLTPAGYTFDYTESYGVNTINVTYPIPTVKNITVGIDSCIVNHLDFATTDQATSGRVTQSFTQVVENISLTYKVYATNELGLTTEDGTTLWEVWVDAATIPGDKYVFKSTSKCIYRGTNPSEFKLMWYEFDLSKKEWTMKTSDRPSTVLPDPAGTVKHHVELYRNDSTTPSETRSATGTRLWFNVIDQSTLSSYEDKSVSVVVNDTNATQYNASWYYINLANDMKYDYAITTTRIYHGFSRESYTTSESFSTLTALMYFDADGNWGINTMPEPGCITCSAFNIYQPHHTDDNEFPLFAFRDKVGDTYNVHIMLAHLTEPVTENGSTVTITGKFYLIQILNNQTTLAMGLGHLQKPTVSCTAVDGTGTLWSISDWEVVSTYPIRTYPTTNNTSVGSRNSYNNVQRVEYVAETSITIDTDVQLEKEFAYTVEYSDYGADASPNLSTGVYNCVVRVANEHSDMYDTNIPDYEDYYGGSEFVEWTRGREGTESTWYEIKVGKPTLTNEQFPQFNYPEFTPDMVANMTATTYN